MAHRRGIGIRKRLIYRRCQDASSKTSSLLELLGSRYLARVR